MNARRIGRHLMSSSARGTRVAPRRIINHSVRLGVFLGMFGARTSEATSQQQTHFRAYRTRINEAVWVEANASAHRLSAEIPTGFEAARRCTALRMHFERGERADGATGP